jgi:GNAT superfamily N-acetyltransferase
MPILRSLPDWFGIEEAVLNYEREIGLHPTFLAKSAEQVLGFLSLKQHTPFAAEVYVMGVRPVVHRNGIGRALMEKAVDYARTLGIEYLQVKTLGPSRPDVGYGKTRAFYEAAGFRPLEEFKQLWGDQNPCLILVKRI